MVHFVHKIIAQLNVIGFANLVGNRKSKAIGFHGSSMFCKPLKQPCAINFQILTRVGDGYFLIPGCYDDFTIFMIVLQGIAQ